MLQGVSVGIYSRGDGNYSPSPWHCSWCSLHMGIPMSCVRRYIPETMRTIPLPKLVMPIKGFNVSNRIIDGMRLPTHWQLMLLLIEVHVFTGFLMESPTEWEFQRAGNQCISDWGTHFWILIVYYFTDGITNKIKICGRVFEIYSATQKF